MPAVPFGFVRLVQGIACACVCSLGLPLVQCVLVSIAWASYRKARGKYHALAHPVNRVYTLFVARRHYCPYTLRVLPCPCGLPVSPCLSTLANVGTVARLVRVYACSCPDRLAIAPKPCLYSSPSFSVGFAIRKLPRNCLWARYTTRGNDV